MRISAVDRPPEDRDHHDARVRGDNRRGFDAHLRQAKTEKAPAKAPNEPAVAEPEVDAVELVAEPKAARTDHDCDRRRDPRAIAALQNGHAAAPDAPIARSSKHRPTTPSSRRR